jgi:thiol-disulfide isomerase/thioredoxin
MIDRLLLALVLLATLMLIGSALRAQIGRKRAALLGTIAPTPAAGRPSVLALSGPGCGACRTQHRILDALRAEWTGDLEVQYVDAVAVPDLARRFGVIVVPTTVVAAADGRVVGINGGLADGDRLRSQLRQALA